MIDYNKIRKNLGKKHIEKVNERFRDDDIIHLTKEAHREIKKILKKKRYFYV